MPSFMVRSENCGGMWRCHPASQRSESIEGSIDMSDHLNPDQSAALSEAEIHPGESDQSNRSARRPSHTPNSLIARPRQIQIAVIGMWVGAAMSIIYVFVWYLELRTLNAKNSAALEEKYGDQLISADSLMDAGMVFSLGLNAVAALVAVAVWAWMAITNGRGIAWARIVATVLGAIGLLNTGFAASAAYAEGILIPTSVIYYSANLVLVIAIIVLIWLPASTAFYKASSTRPRRV